MVALLTAACSANASKAIPAHPLAQPPAALIAYSLNPSLGTERVWTVDPTTDKRTFRAEANLQGWSADGQSLLVQTKHQQLVIVDVRTGSQRPVPHTAWADTGAWSPNGQWIAFNGTLNAHSKHPRLYVEHPDGTGLHAVGPTEAQFTSALSISWSPDDTALAVELDADTEAASGLWLIPVGGSSRRRVAPMASGDVDEFGGQWSRTSEIAYTCQHRSRHGAISLEGLPPGSYDISQICTFGSSGRAEQLLTPRALWAYDPAWSPSGQQLAFTGIDFRHHHGKRAIFVINGDGSGLRRVSPFREQADFPTWSPDGSNIAYLGGIARTETRGNHHIPILDTGLFVAKVSSGRERELLGSVDLEGPNISNDDGGRTPIAWQPT